MLTLFKHISAPSRVDGELLLPFEQRQKSRLKATLTTGEEVVIVRGNVRIAKLVAEVQTLPKRREAGRGQGQILFMAEDFNAPLEDFQEYMQ